MINLLLPENKKRILNEYRLRLIVVYIIALGLLLTTAIIAVMAFYSALFIDKISLQEVLQLEDQKTEVKEFDSYSTRIIGANKMINLLDNDHNNLHIVSNLFDQIIVAKPVGLKLGTIEIKPSDKNQWALSLRGISGQRSDITSFIKTLRESPLVVAVDSPLANLIKGGTSEFTIVVTLTSNLTSEKHGE
jgi:hypothetical protein